MRPDLAARLRAVMRGEPAPATGATAKAGVTDTPRLRRKSPELRKLRRLRPKNAEFQNSAEGRGYGSPQADDWASIEGAGSVPGVYGDAWARLNHQKPFRVSEAEWRRALDAGGRFLTAWASMAAAWGWTPGDLFDLPRDGGPGGLVWFIEGEEVQAFGPEHARTLSGRVFDRLALRDGGQEGA